MWGVIATTKKKKVIVVWVMGIDKTTNEAFTNHEKINQSTWERM